MDFYSFSIPAKGRSNYSTQTTSADIVNTMKKATYYNIVDTTPDIPDIQEQEASFCCFLNRTNVIYDGQELSLANITDTIGITAYRNITKADVYITDLHATAEDGTVEHTNYDIQGLPNQGMTVVVQNNGTPDATIVLTVTSALTQTKGTLLIPVNVFLNTDEDEPLGNSLSTWETVVEECKSVWLEYNWDVISVPTDKYSLELTNDNASINCDSDGNILSGAIRPTCTAELYYGIEKVTGATYGISYLSTQNVVGVSIDTTTGILTFGSNFTFDGTPLEIMVTASIDDNVVGRKVMTISKAIAGQKGENGGNGEDAVTCWLIPSATAIYVDYNTTPPQVTPAAISVKAMKQVGGNAPEEYTDTIYYGYDTDAPSMTYNNSIAVDVSKKYISIGIKNNGYYYDLETIPLIQAGLNGADGEDGKDGTDGKDGKDGQSAYRLDLSNNNASINCDSNGNILSGAYKPQCTAKLFLGTTVVNNCVYEIVAMSETTDVTINSSTGVITVGDIDFANTSLEITVAAKISGVIYGQSIMTITKSFAGKDGAKGDKGEDGADGVNGKDGVSIVWKGEFSSHPSNPSNGWAYRNSSDKKSYTYQDGAWYQMTVDGTDGKDGKDGTSISIAGTLSSSSQLPNPPSSPNDCYIIGQDIWIWDGAAWYNGGQFKGDNGVSIVWKGSHASHPSNPSNGWAYYNTTEKKSYIYDGTAWDIMTYDGIDGTNGVDGVSIIWKGESSSAPSNPQLNWCYRDTDNGKVYIYNGVAWELMVLDGVNGTNGVNGADGVDGKDGVSIVWLGELSSHPSYPSNGNAYKNTTDKTSYIYQDGTWYQMTIDGIDGQNGKDGVDGKDGQDGADGLSIVWKGDLASPPSNPATNWCYRDTDNGKVYIYNGTAWELMVLDGTDGVDGANGTDGADGLSVFITYHDNPITSTPSKPIGNGTANGWHTDATSSANWMSQKVASDASTGTWGSPIQICGADGQDGQDGADGEDAVSYWMSFSTNEVKVDKSGTATPSTITVTAYKQVGTQSPINVTSNMVIKYGYNTVSPQNTYSSSIVVNTAYDYLTFALYTSSGVKVDGNETVLILKDGVDGEDGKDGTDGRQGAALRGPVNYYAQTTSRRWCNGTLTNASYPEDAQFIDLMIKDNVTYICKVSYVGSANDTWSYVSSYWTPTDKQYDFIATNLLLADNASIDFATSNALYLRDSDGNITAGAEGGNEISFWAGANEPENGAFKVNYDGTMEATKGKFGHLEIGKDDWDASSLYGHYEDFAGKWDLSLQPHMITMEGKDTSGVIRETINIAPYPNADKYDREGAIGVTFSNIDGNPEWVSKQSAFHTNGTIDASSFQTWQIIGNIGFTTYAPMSIIPMRIDFMTSNSAKFAYNTTTGVWTFNGNEIFTNSNEVMGTNYEYTTVTTNNGQWVFKNGNGAMFGTGIWALTKAKENNVIYLVI